ncbi:cation diffusion facilitator family transporter [Modestobacter marinus]|uniref:Cation diffusion facilitator family transporter n=1 Tax=Modestobacter marinus TaxID=477641 RepID=A0A846LUM2_9ACTN|nr:cation diffusion facilitator family transporter [Modestobacter marinus]NIH67139.1 cation diffusion facilitator family transporter [Modestobacter marinus]GGL52339.1 cation diffusion facilitator transporter [Modestobacter marinus]
MTQPTPATEHALVQEAQGGDSGGESTGTVVLAGAVNLAIAAAKLAGGLVSHSSAMLSEAAHSLADTVTEVLLFVALKRGHRAADARHPFGYGRETYFWAFLASLCTFAVGAGFSVYQGIETIREGEEQGSPTISYIVLAVSFVLEGSSLLKAVRQVRGEARSRGVSPRRYLRRTTDTTLKAVTFEDSAALIGLVLAALGLFLEHVTGNPLWDGISAILIGVLLIAVAWSLARANVSLLIGQSVPDSVREQLRAEIAGLEQVDAVPFLLTSVIGPGQLIVSAKVDFADTATVADIEAASDEAERRLVARHGGVRYVFLDPTPGDGQARAAAPPAG